MIEKKKNYDLEERLIAFSVFIIALLDDIQKTKASTHLAGQLARSGTSVSLNYGEAQSAESRKDFIHKMKVVLKELRESYVCLKILEKINVLNSTSKIKELMKENNELISIFVKSLQTARRTAMVAG